MKSSPELGSSARHADAAAHFIARYHGSEKPFAVDLPARRTSASAAGMASAPG